MSPDFALPVLGVIGLLLSMYVIRVERGLENDLQYSPMCDVKSAGVSCSTVFRSDAGHILSYLKLVPKGSSLDISNGVSGAIFYAMLFVIPNLTFLSKGTRLALSTLMTIGSTATSIILGYVMIYDLKEICMVCSTIYAINIFVLIWTMRWIRSYFGSSTSKRTKKIV